jgi:long-chain acyl-CoA synthetase
MTSPGEDGSAHARPWLARYPAHAPAELTDRPFESLVDLLEHRAQASPEAASILYFDSTITHGEARRHAHAFATALQEELGIAAGSRLALHLQNVPQMVMALHGGWLAGVITAGVNVMCTREEIATQLAISGARVLVCHEADYEKVYPLVADGRLDVVITVSELDFLDRFPRVLAGRSRRACPGAVSFMDLLRKYDGRTCRARASSWNDPVALTFTSGTTGVAKAAIVTNANLLSAAEVFVRWLDMPQGTVTMGMSPMFHITGLLSQFCVSRMAAGPIILMYRFDAAECLRLMAQWRAGWAVGPLTVYLALLQHRGFDKYDLSSLRFTASGGAPVHKAVVRRWREATGLRLLNTYGLTEVTGPATIVPPGADAPVDAESGSLSVGVPITGFDLSIRDISSGRTVAIGEPGEIWLQGPQLSPGYWMNPAETRAAYSEGWLRTGDIGMQDQEGWIYVLDRAKDVIIASGFKVWPSEVEGVLHQHVAVREAAVVGVNDSYRGETVKAYVALKPGREVGESEIIDFCREHLAAYKSPRIVEFVDRLPKTASGKIQRARLPRRSQ